VTRHRNPKRVRRRLNNQGGSEWHRPNPNQKEDVLKRIKRNWLTSHEALTELGVARLASRITDLKDDGHTIKKKRVEVVARNGRVAHVMAYKLAPRSPSRLSVPALPHHHATTPVQPMCRSPLLTRLLMTEREPIGFQVVVMSRDARAREARFPGAYTVRSSADQLVDL
jgi:hypothetical protein